jgi:hypothetical protein
MIEFQKNKKLLWGENVFNYTHKKNKVLIGRDLIISCRSNGRIKVLEGICITFRSKKMDLLTSSIVLRKKIYDVILFFDVLLYLLSSLDHSVISFSYSRRIACSRLTQSRFLN